MALDRMTHSKVVHFNLRISRRGSSISIHPNVGESGQMKIPYRQGIVWVLVAVAVVVQHQLTASSDRLSLERAVRTRGADVCYWYNDTHTCDEVKVEYCYTYGKCDSKNKCDVNSGEKYAGKFDWWADCVGESGCQVPDTGDDEYGWHCSKTKHICSVYVNCTGTPCILDMGVYKCPASGTIHGPVADEHDHCEPKYNEEWDCDPDGPAS